MERTCLAQLQCSPIGTSALDLTPEAIDALPDKTAITGSLKLDCA